MAGQNLGPALLSRLLKEFMEAGNFGETAFKKYAARLKLDRALVQEAAHGFGGLPVEIIDGRAFVVKEIHKSGLPLMAPRSRLVATLAIGRDLKSGEVVHHKNGDPLDDRPENLEVLSRAEHSRFHNRRRPDEKKI